MNRLEQSPQAQGRQVPATIHSPASGQRRIAVITIALPAMATAAAIGLAVTGVARPSLFELQVTLALCLTTQLGITIGFHRLFSHRSFETVPVVRLLLGIAGSMAAQGPLLFWVSEHRQHHQKSDSVGDPHSPYRIGAATLCERSRRSTP